MHGTRATQHAVAIAWALRIVALPAARRGAVRASASDVGVPFKKPAERMSGRRALLHVAQGGASHTQETLPDLSHPVISLTTTGRERSNCGPSLSSNGIPGAFIDMFSFALRIEAPENSSSQMRPSGELLRAFRNCRCRSFLTSESPIPVCRARVSPPILWAPAFSSGGAAVWRSTLRGPPAVSCQLGARRPAPAPLAFRGVSCP